MVSLGVCEDRLTVKIEVCDPAGFGVGPKCPEAALGLDKFHRIKLAHKSVDPVRRRESRELSWCEERRKKSRDLWLKNPQNLTETQTASLEGIGQLSQCTAKGYQMRQTLRDIHATCNNRRALRHLRAWERHIKILHARDPWLAPMAKLSGSLAKHLDGIRAPRESLLINAFMGDHMCTFSATQRKRRG